MPYIETKPKYGVLDKIIKKCEIMPYFSIAKRGCSTKSDMDEGVNTILHKLKTGCQWERLPVESFSTMQTLGSTQSLSVTRCMPRVLSRISVTKF